MMLETKPLFSGDFKRASCVETGSFLHLPGDVTCLNTFNLSCFRVY